jgi:fluoride exporter
MLEIRSLVCVGAGGLIGTVLRYLIMNAAYALAGQLTVFATLTVNIIGSFAIGILHGYSQYLSTDSKTFLMAGVLGGFTTFSTFALDSVTLADKTTMMLSASYIAASVIFSILAVLAGMALTHWILPS